MDFLEYPDVSQEVRGSLNRGRLKMTNQALIFKFTKTGKVDQIQGSDIEEAHWQRMAGQFGLRITTKNNQLYRFCNFKEVEFEKLAKFFQHNYSQTLEEKPLSMKGWNWGVAKFSGSVLSFEVGSAEAFSVPLTTVSHCTTAKNEVTLEFHQNDDAAVSLMELRFHIPNDSSEVDPAQAFHNNVMQKANIIQATGDAIATFQEVQCLTPRGRYDIKIFPTFVQLHGKTFDYKIPLTTVLRLFLLPHKDQRQTYFVVSLDPPIKQGQTRYHFLILLFNNEEESTIEVALSEKDLEEKYEGKLEKEMSGLTYQLMSKMIKALVNRKITQPGDFKGHSGTPAISCSYKAAAGLMYPLERGLIYVYKPPIHLRFEEIDGVNFARSGGSTRTFDFEVELKNGTVHTFSSIEKDEYVKLFDFIKGKKLRVKNRGQMGGKGGGYKEDLVDSDQEAEPDAYLARVKAEAKERDDDDGGDSDDESTDESFNPGESGSEVAEEFDSNASSSSSDEDGEGGGGSGEEGKKRKHKEEKKKPKKAKTVAERKPRKEKKQKSDKDPNRPKRPQSAYFLWLNESRESIKKEHPGISVTEISKKAGAMWKEITNKSKWDKMAEEEKKKYEVAMAEYNASGGGGDRSPKKSKSKTPSSSSKKPKPSAKKESPQKGSFKSKEYISSSDASDGSDSDKDAKKKKPSKKKEKPPVKKEKSKSSSDEEEEEEEKKAESTPASSEDEKAASSAASSDEKGKDSGSASGEDSD